MINYFEIFISLNIFVSTRRNTAALLIQNTADERHAYTYGVLHILFQLIYTFLRNMSLGHISNAH